MNKKLYERIMQNVKAGLSEMASNAQVGDFDELDAFDDEYIKVKRNNKYNLIDAGGKYLSDKWFDSVKKVDGKVETELSKDNIVIKHTYQDVKNLHKEHAIMDMVDNDDFLKYIKVSDIVILTPFDFETATGTVRIVAEVVYNNKEYYIGKDGQLYDKNQQRAVSTTAAKVAGCKMLDILNRISYKVYSRFDCNKKYDCNDDTYMFWMTSKNDNDGFEACSLQQDKEISDLDAFNSFILNIDAYRIDMFNKDTFKNWLCQTMHFQYIGGQYDRVTNAYDSTKVGRMLEDIEKIEKYIDTYSTRSLQEACVIAKRHKALNEMAATKEQVGKFDNIYPFSSIYMKVERDGKYNLIDSRDGHYMSKVWFDMIDKNTDGSIITKRADNTGNNRTETYKDLGTFCAAPIIWSAAANQDTIRRIINIVKIDNVTEYHDTFDTVDNGTVNIIAKVKYDGMTLLMDENGKLYKEDGTEYVLSAAYFNNVHQNFELTTWDNLVSALMANIVEFIFTKVDGTYRVAFGTLANKIITEDKPNGYKNTLQFFDVVKSAWRSISKKDSVHADVVIVNLFDVNEDISEYINDTDKIIEDYKKLIKAKDNNTQDDIITVSTNNETPAPAPIIDPALQAKINEDAEFAQFIKNANINYDAISYIGNTMYINMSAGDIVTTMAAIRRVLSKSKYEVQFINRTPFVGGMTIKAIKRNVENISQMLPMLDNFKNAQMGFITFDGFRITKSLEDILNAINVKDVNAENSHMWFRRADKISKKNFKNKHVDLSGIDPTINGYIE